MKNVLFGCTIVQTKNLIFKIMNIIIFAKLLFIIRKKNGSIEFPIRVGYRTKNKFVGLLKNNYTRTLEDVVRKNFLQHCFV